MKKLVIILVGVFCLTGCLSEESINVEQDRIWTYYELLYDANQDITYAIAQFKFGNGLGTFLKLSELSQVTLMERNWFMNNFLRVTASHLLVKLPWNLCI